MLKKIIIISLKLTISSAILAYLFIKIGISSISQILFSLNPVYILIASAIYVITIYISALRWRMLIPQRIKVKELFNMYIIGAFFNICLPGSIGGDAIKTYYLSQMLDKDKNPTATALTSVFMDRYIGLIALITIALCSLPLVITFFKGTPVTDFLLGSTIAIFVGSIAFFTLKLGSRLRFLNAIYNSFSAYKHRRKYLFKSYLYSFAIQAINFVGVYILAIGLGIKISFLYLLGTLPMIVFISFIPISISGLGLREGAFVFFMTRISVRADEALSLSLAWFISSLIGSLIGLIQYLRFKAIFGRKQE